MLARLASLLLFLLVLCVPSAHSQVSQQIMGSQVQTRVIMSGVTTNTTTASIAGVPAGRKTFMGVVSGTGAVTQTQKIYGTGLSTGATAANSVLLCTLTLTDTTIDTDACPVITAAFPFFFVITTNTTGTGATGAVYAMF